MFDTDIAFDENYKSFKTQMAEKRGQKAAQDKLYYDFSEYAKKRAKFGNDPNALEWVVMFNTIGRILEDKEVSDSSSPIVEDDIAPVAEVEDHKRSPLNLDKVIFQKDYETETIVEDTQDDYDAYSPKDKFKNERREGSFGEIDFYALEKVKKNIEAFIGLADVKKSTEDIISFAYLQKLKQERGLNVRQMSFNAAFMGEPGTGKTTMAREYGQLFKALGILEKGHVVEVSRSDLIGPYIGQTEYFTKDVFHSALDGVLFIDEAHNIYDPTCPYDFGRECLATLIKLMEDYRERVVVIFAGYEDQLKNTLFRYEGMLSRIPHLIDFKDYSADELLSIFKKICFDEDYVISKECSNNLLKVLKSQSRKSNKSWNGREIRNLFEKSLILQARRLSKITDPTNEQLKTLESSDLELPADKTDSNIVYL